MEWLFFLDNTEHHVTKTEIHSYKQIQGILL